MKQSQRVLKNSIVGLGSEAIGAGLNLAIIMVLARYLGVSGFGNYSFIMALAGVFQLVADFGLRNILIREIAIDRNSLDRHLGNTKSLIWVLSVIAFLLIAATVSLINPSKEILISTYIAGLAVLTTFHAAGYGAVCRAFEDMEYNGIGYVLHKIIFLLLIGLGTKLKVDLIGIFIIFLLANLSLWLYYYIVVRVKYVRPRLHVDFEYWKSMVKDAFPLGIAAILRKVTWNVDTLILTAMANVTSVGLFSGAYKVIQAVNLIPTTLAQPLFPVFSRLAQKSSDSLFSSYEKSLKFLLIISLPLVVFITVFSQKIVILFLGKQYLQSSIALQLLSWALLFLFPTSLYVYLFTAMGKQKLFAVASAACLGMNAILDIALIPWYSYIGACIGTLASEITLFFVGFYFLRKLGSRFSIFRIAWKPALGSLVMGFFLYPMTGVSTRMFLLSALGGFLIYCAVILVLRTFSREEISMILSGFGVKRPLGKENHILE